MTVIITTTTVPMRLYEHNGQSAAQLAIKTLLEQSYNDYELHFNIPHKYRDIDIVLPQWVSEYQNAYPHFKVFRCKDEGPITKILPTLERIDNPETIIITADDDLYYMDGLIEAHVNARLKYPNCAIGFAGISAIDGSCHFCTTLKIDTRVKILEGYKTVSYLRKFFDTQDFRANFLGKSWRDDETLSAYMGYRDIAKVVVAYDKESNFDPRVESFPVTGHVPTERSGCSHFRDSQEMQQISEENIQMFFKLGYLEK